MKMAISVRILAITSLLMLAVSFAFCEEAAQEAASAPDQPDIVKVDLAKDAGPVTYRASGFLHAISVTEPSPALVDQLKPKLFRMRAEDWSKEGKGGFANYKRVKMLGARLQIVMSDSHGYALAGWWPGDTEERWTQWLGIVEGLLKISQALKMDVEWDIWNEPNLGYFWGRDRERFFETWRKAYLKIRELDPKAIIVGPSISGYDGAWMEAFLKYAKTNSVLPDILAWHQFTAPKTIPKQVKEAQDLMAANGIDIKRICLNEILTVDQTLRPGVTVCYFASLERLKIDGACHACWNDKEQGVSACENNSLDGILTHPDKQPRSAWWAYKCYADITGRLVDVESGEKVDGVAGKDAKAKTVKILLGGTGKKESPGIKVDLNIANMKSAPFPAKTGKVHVVVERIPASGYDAVTSLTKTIDADYQVKDNQLKIELPDFGPADAYFITLGPVRK